MKKYLSILLILVLVIGLFLLTGCQKNEEKEPLDEVTENVVTEPVTEKTIDRTNSKLKTNEEIEKQIETSTKDYFTMVYGEKVLDARILKVEVCPDDAEILKNVDLAENDYAFEIDYELKPVDEKYVPDLTEELGRYDEESGWVKDCHGFGVMRYNEIDDGYDVTSITEKEKYE